MRKIKMNCQKSITFEEGCNLYLQNCKERNLREDTIRHYRQSYLRFYRYFDRAILHSCGNLSAVYEDIINDMGYDGKHSYQDIICPVETMYDQYGDRLAIMGGLDINYLCKMPEEDITKRARAML